MERIIIFLWQTGYVNVVIKKARFENNRNMKEFCQKYDTIRISNSVMVIIINEQSERKK